MKGNQPSETYRRLYRDIIEELVEQICSHNDNYAMRYNTDGEKTAVAIWRKFEEYRVKTSQHMSSNRLDRHKLASCICGAIIEVQPLEGYLGAEINKIANEILALHTGLSIVKLYMIDDLAEKLGILPEAGDRMTSYLYKNFSMRLPSLEENICDVQEYERNLLNALYWSHFECPILKKECFRYDVWAYAKIFYHLELYNRKYFDKTYQKYVENQK